jgi:3',5'-cyclic AMP phosphodiesterase CpdA
MRLITNLFIASLLILSACTQQPVPVVKPANEFTFAFLTDIHVQREQNAISGFRKAITKVNGLKPDFVITGGDLVMDCLGQTFGRADSLYNIYTKMQTEFTMPVFNTIGNHEHYGWYVLKGADTLVPEYGKQMFEKRIGPRFQRIDRNGWVFLLLDSVVKDGKGGYEGGIDPEQMEWIKEQVANIPAETPIVISTHIPFMTMEAQIFEGSTAANGRAEVIVNAKDILKLFKGHNLKLVLQGHLHYYETMHAMGTSFVTGGSVAAKWWEGPYEGTEEGFLLLKVKDSDVTWEYIDYGWVI